MVGAPCYATEAYSIPIRSSFRDTHLCVGPESILPVVVMDSGLAGFTRALRCAIAHRGMTAYLHQKHTLAVDLLVEQLVGLVRLIDAPVVGEEFVDVDAALDRKPRAVRLDDVGERP